NTELPDTGTRSANRLNVVFGLTQSQVEWTPLSNLYLDQAATIVYTAGTKANKVYTVSSNGGTFIYNAKISAPTGCESVIPVSINVIDVLPVTVANQVFCQPTSVNDIVIGGAVSGVTYNIYDSVTSTTPISTISTTGTYYIEGEKGDCTSV